MYLAVGQAVQRFPVWTRPLTYEAHASNGEMAIRLAEFFNVDVSAEIIDDGVAIYFPAPHSYTGEDVAEFHIHGSRAVVTVRLAKYRRPPSGYFDAESFDISPKAPCTVVMNWAGKMMVEFFSTEISAMVWRVRS